MNMNKLARELCAREGKKKQVDIAQVKELLGHLSDIFCEEAESAGCPTYVALVNNGIKRMHKRAKRRKGKGVRR